MKKILFDLFEQYEEYEDIIDSLRSMLTEKEITDNDFDYTMDNYDDILEEWLSKEGNI